MHWFLQFFLLLSREWNILPNHLCFILHICARRRECFCGSDGVCWFGYLLLLQEENRFVHLKFTELNSLIFKPEIDDVALKVEKLMFSAKWLLYKLMFDWSVLF